MKLIDQTPFYSENGEITFTDRAKAILKFGPGWFKEMEAQKTIVSIFNRVLDKNFTLLRNITPPGLDARIPFILVGPTGVYVMYVTPVKGMFRAKGDEWGTVVNGAYKPEKPNLLFRTQRMAEAVQVFVQRQGYADITSVEPLLLCSDPSVTVDSLRPIIRVVMSDALERLAVSISQARVIISPETAYNIVRRLLNPVTSAPEDKLPETPAPEVTSAPPPPTEAEANPYVPAFALPESESALAEPVPESGTSPFPFREPESKEEAPVIRRRRRSRARISRGQWLFLIILFVTWLIIVGIFIYIILSGGLLF